ncbi:MAG: RIP metalloprotease RseP [bacterium]|jgi:regulator of sigma E protease|nr:MAG: RIP metalloprotease RseP [bacterium]
MLITILATIVVLGVLIFVHELGHFMAAKAVDIEVPRFSIGLGPKLWGFRRGETEYVISWLPLGGYVKMAGMEEMEPIEGGKAERDDGAVPVSDVGLVQETPARGPRDFESKSLPARTMVISAGVLMNTLFAFLVFTFSAAVWGVQKVPPPRIAAVNAERLPAGAEALAALPPSAEVVAVGDRRTEDWLEVRSALLIAPAGPVTLSFADGRTVTIDLPADDSLRADLVRALEPELAPVVGRVEPGSPAERAGLQAGDSIVEAGGRPVRVWQDLIAVVSPRAGEPIDMVVVRDGRRVSLTVVPEARRVAAGADAGASGPAVGRIGVETAILRERPGALGAVAVGARETWSWIALTVGFLGDLITGDASPRNIGGPILIGQFSGQVVRAGLEEFLRFMAIFSINLAVLNLLPIPVLDGGHLLFLAIEAVRGRALSLRQRMRLTQVGLVIVVAIMVWALANDVLRLFGL